MNLILINRSDVIAVVEEKDGHPPAECYMTIIKGRQMKHCLEILKVKEGSKVRIGVKNGGIGMGIVLSIHMDELQIQLPRPLHLEPSEARVPSIDLLLAMPRPKTFVKILQYAASLGVRRMVFTCSEKVEKSYFSSPKLSALSIHENLQLGLEQSMFTRYPEVYIYASWKGMMQSIFKMKLIDENIMLLLAEPSATSTLHTLPTETDRYTAAFLAIGPEGGWIPTEIEDLKALGFQAFTFGHPILRCEASVIYLIGQLHLLLPKAIHDITQPEPCWSITTKNEKTGVLKDSIDENGVIIMLPKRYQTGSGNANNSY